MSADRNLSVGAMVAGRYKLVETLGRGGMGTVWRATDERESREVALKIIRPKGSDGKPSSTAVGRFLREFRAMDRLRSPHVVPVYDHASDGELVYISMELLHGDPLRDRLKQYGKLDAHTTLRVLTHVGRAVALAHQRGIVHRDLKPGNIYLCERDDDEEFVCKVLDFGMAKSLATPLSTVDPVRTELGRPLGTPYYMSPEQARGMASVDHRSDLWAIGVLAYECLCGQRPFQGKSLAQVFAAIASSALPVPSKVAEVPIGFDAWFERACHRDVQRRFQSAKLMLEELQDVLGEETTIKRMGATLSGMTVSDVAETHVQLPSFGGRTLRRPPTTASSSFVGREDELRALRKAIDSHCRVLTVTGMPGSGRRRLLHEFASRESAKLSGGAWSCSLGAARDTETLWLELAIALGVRLSDHEPVERIGRALFGLGRIMLVCEDVDDIQTHLGAALTRWLSMAPQAIFAVTSRHEIGVPTESVLALEGLPTPPSAENIEDLGRAPAAELFLRRAINFQRSLLAAHSEAGSIARICRRMFGHPLAIEVLASMVEQMNPTQMLAGMERTMLQPGGTTIMHPETLVMETLRWAWAQLSLPERSALTQSGIFRGGFTLQAAEAVIDLAQWPDAPPVADLVQRFVAHGLLRRTIGAFGEGRFDLHPAIGTICTERLRKGRGVVLNDTADGPAAAAELEHRHARYFAQLGSEEALEALTCRGGPVRRGRYALEWDNVLVALERSVLLQDGDVMAQLCLAAAAIQSLQGRHAAAARTLLRGAVAEGASDPLRLACMVAQARELFASARFDTAIDVYQRAGERARSLSDTKRMAATSLGMGQVYLAYGNAAAARNCFEQARQLSEQRGDRQGHAEALRGLAALNLAARDVLTAMSQLDAALLAHQQLGARRLEADTQTQRGTAFNDQGQRHEARMALETALAIYGELGERFEEARVLGRLGALSAVGGRIDDGLAQLEQAIARSGELGARTLEGELLGVVAELQARRGKPERSWPAVHRAEQLLRSESADSYPLARLLCRRAHIENASGQRDKAMNTLSEVESIMTRLTSSEAARLQGVVTRVRRSLG